MKHKGLIRLFSIAAALLLPLGAMAQGAAVDLLKQAEADGKETVTTITFAPGQTLAADQIVADLSAAAALRFNSVPGGLGAFTLVLSGVDSFTAQFRALTDGLFVQSEILGTKPLYVAWDDLQKLMAESMKGSGMEGAGMGSFGNGFMGGFKGGMMTDWTTNADGTPVTEEQVKQKIIEAMGGDDSYVKWIEAIEAKKVVTTGEFTLEGSDVADTKTELTVTKEDMAALYEIPYVQKQMAAQLKAQDNTLTDEQADAKVKEVVGQIKDALDKSDAVVPMTFLTKGETELIAMQIKGSGLYQNTVNDVTTNADGSTTTNTTTTLVPVSFDMVYTNKAVDGGKLHVFTLTGSEKDVKRFAVKGSLTTTDKTAVGTLTVTDDADKPKLLVDLTCDYSDAKHTFGELALTVYDTTNTAILFGYDQVVGDATIDTTLAVSSGASIDAIKADAATAMLGTLKVNTVVQADSGTFAAIKEATPATSLEIAKLSDADMQTYVGSLQGNAMQALYKIMGNLPQSVSSLLFGTKGN